MRMPSPQDYSNLEVGSYTSEKIPIPDGPSPRSYLDFAVEDLAGSSERSRVNALSNAKRALHFQVELIAGAYGFQRMSKRTSFYEKLEFCKRCGIVGPRILNKLNKVRNAVEHDYYIPTQAEVEDFVDVVELFLFGTDRFLTRFPADVEIGFDSKVDPSAPDIRGIDIHGGSVYLFVHPGHTEGLTTDTLHEWQRQHSVKVDQDDPAYFEWVKFAIANAD
jgi:hypothetical protein